MKKLIFICIVFISFVSLGQTPSFPSAIGAGAFATHARGGDAKVYHVNTLTWTAASSYDAVTDTYSGGLRAALLLDVKLCVVFDVAGAIDATSSGELYFTSLTDQGKYVAGQTAPGKIVIYTDYFQFNNLKNTIFRYISFVSQSESGYDTLWVNAFGASESVENVIFDHCSFYYGNDECLSIAGSSGQGTVTNITVQYCVMGSSSKGSIIGSYTDGSDATTARNLYVDLSYRTPNMLGNGTSRQDAINNFVENFGDRLIRTTGSGDFYVKNNYAQPNRGADYGRHRGQITTGSEPQIWSSGNIIEGVFDTPASPDISNHWRTFAGSTIGENQPIPAEAIAPSEFTQVGRTFTVYDADDIKDSILPFVGNRLRLSGDGSVIEDEYALDTYFKDLAINPVATMTQRREPDPKYPTVSGGTAYTDTDRDGMPDAWEIANGLDEDVNDAFGHDLDADYENIEMFLNLVDGETSPPSAGYTVTPTSGLVTAEVGGTDTFTVVLDVEPTGNVVFDITSNDTGEGTVSPSTLTFTTENWDTPQTVTITGVDDELDDGNVAYTVTVAIDDASSADEYDALPDTTVNVTNTDDDGGEPEPGESSGRIAKGRFFVIDN